MKILSGVIISLFSLFITLVLIEVVLRSGLLERAEVRSDRPKRFYIPSQSLGSRDFSYETMKPNNTFRVVVIGDSFTYGVNVQFDDSFPKRLERMYRLVTASERIEVINYSKPGFSSFDEVALVEKAVKGFSPDLILLEITLNDAEKVPYRAGIGRKAKGEEEQEGTFLISSLIRTRLKALRKGQQFVDYHQALFRDPELWERFSGALERMKGLCKQSGVPFAAVIFPLLTKDLSGGYPFIELHHKISRKLDFLEIPSLDLWSAFEGLDGERLQVIPGRDSHPNEIGHRIAAEAIYDWLGVSKLVPERFYGAKFVPARDIVNPFPISAPTPEVSLTVSASVALK